VIRKARGWALLAGVLVLACAGTVAWQWPWLTSSGGGQSAQSPTGHSQTGPGSGGQTGQGQSSTSASDRPAANWPGYLPDPAKRMLLGAYINLTGGQNTEATVQQREAAMGRNYDLQVTYYEWKDVFPDSGEATMVARGRTPLMTWYGPGKYASDHHTLPEINSGADDTLILSQAEAMKAFGHRIYLRLMPEMNGTWYAYSGDPAAYISAWRRIHRLFAEAGASNVTWVWCPNVTPDGWDKYYPGNAYVDVIGVDGFSNTTYGYQTFEQLFAPFLMHFAGRKPLMIVEVATNSGAGDKAAGIGSAASFIDGMHSYLKNIAGPRYGVTGVCWFDTNNTDQYNWRVDQTQASWKAWLNLVRDPYFGGLPAA